MGIYWADVEYFHLLLWALKFGKHVHGPMNMGLNGPQGLNGPMCPASWASEGSSWHSSDLAALSSLADESVSRRPCKSVPGGTS